MCLSYLFMDCLQEGLRKPDCLLKASGPFSSRFPAVSQGLNEFTVPSGHRLSSGTHFS